MLKNKFFDLKENSGKNCSILTSKPDGIFQFYSVNVFESFHQSVHNQLLAISKVSTSLLRLVQPKQLECPNQSQNQDLDKSKARDFLIKKFILITNRI